MNPRDPQGLIEKLKNRMAEVEDFIDFLRTREDDERKAAADRLGRSVATLAALDLLP